MISLMLPLEVNKIIICLSHLVHLKDLKVAWHFRLRIKLTSSRISHRASFDEFFSLLVVFLRLSLFQIQWCILFVLFHLYSFSLGGFQLYEYQLIQEIRSLLDISPVLLCYFSTHTRTLL